MELWLPKINLILKFTMKEEFLRNLWPMRGGAKQDKGLNRPKALQV